MYYSVSRHQHQIPCYSFVEQEQPTFLCDTDGHLCLLLDCNLNSNCSFKSKGKHLVDRKLFLQFELEYNILHSNIFKHQSMAHPYCMGLGLGLEKWVCNPLVLVLFPVLFPFLVYVVCTVNCIINYKLLSIVF